MCGRRTSKSISTGSGIAAPGSSLISPDAEVLRSTELEIAHGFIDQSVQSGQPQAVGVAQTNSDAYARHAMILAAKRLVEIAQRLSPKFGRFAVIVGDIVDTPAQTV